MKKYQPDTQEKIDDAFPTPAELADAIIDDLLATVKTNDRIINRRVLADSILNGFAKLELATVADDVPEDASKEVAKTKFSYADEFNRVADVVRVGNDDDVRIGYSVFVGDPDDPDNEIETFLGEFFSADDFTTWSDAAKAKQLAVIALRQVDARLAMGLKLSVVRDEVLVTVAKKFDVDGNPDDPDVLNLRPAVEYAIKKIFDYYISHGA